MININSTFTIDPSTLMTQPRTQVGESGQYEGKDSRGFYVPLRRRKQEQGDGDKPKKSPTHEGGIDLTA
jgi:hypothetical protein